MKICIAIPTPIEIETSVWERLKTNNNIDLLLTGIGIANTIFQLTKYLILHKIDFVIHGGIAGTFSSEHKIGQVFQVVRDSFADFGVNEQDAFIHASEIFNEPKWFNNAFNHNIGIPPATGITVNSITANINTINIYSQNFNADIETLENAAVFLVCKQLNIPFLSIRSVSNRVGDRNKQNWNIGTAVENLWLILKKIVNNFHE